MPQAASKAIVSREATPPRAAPRGHIPRDIRRRGLGGGLLLEHIFGGYWNGVAALQILDLPADEAAVPEGGFRAGEVELPHSQEALIVKGDDVLPAGIGPPIPFLSVWS